MVETFDWPALRRYFADLVARREGSDWPEVANKLSRYGHREFEDHHP